MPTALQQLLGGPVNKPGFCGSEHGSVRATVYRRGGGSLTLIGGPLPLDGQTLRSAGPAIVSCQTQNVLGQGGTWQLGLKCPPDLDLFGLVDDDDWIDIELGRGNTFWHVMRGLVEEVRCATQVTGSGVTSSNWMLAGASFQKVWANTPLWFSAVRAENLGQKQLYDRLGFARNVPGTIASFLYDYTNFVAQARRSSVALPPGMPGGNTSFSDAWRQDETGYTDALPREALLKTEFFPNQNVWEAAASWADPYFVEMYTELLPDVPAAPAGGERGGQLLCTGSSMASMAGLAQPLASGLPIGQSRMTLVVRDKPFIAVGERSAPRVGQASPWFDLPMTQVPRQHLLAVDLGRSGAERHNAFLCACQLADSGRSISVRDISFPLWAPEDMAVHGYRPMDVVSRYLPTVSKINAYAFQLGLRERLRDWYMAAALYLQGSVAFGRGYPELKVGTRLRLVGNDASDQLTFYVEQVSHTFAPGQGIRTSCGVTRGYQGSDGDHLALLKTLAAQYVAPEL